MKEELVNKRLKNKTILTYHAAGSVWKRCNNAESLSKNNGVQGRAADEMRGGLSITPKGHMGATVLLPQAWVTYQYCSAFLCLLLEIKALHQP